MSIEKRIGITILSILVLTFLIYFTSSKKIDRNAAKENYVSVPAPEISTPNGFVNTNGEEITLAGYRGKKVVLLDIWTYSCINCQRTIPYLNVWYEKYSDKGLEIIGLHTPEFAFEQKIENVQDAVERFGIKYPVVLDNDYSTWRALGNQHWPRKYLIDLDGNIIYDHIGEGDYEETEKAIQDALGISEEINNSGLENVLNVERGKVESREIYFGASRNKNFANGIQSRLGIQDLTIPEKILPNLLYLGGEWNINSEYSETVSDSVIKFNFTAKNVYMVLNSEENIQAQIYIDGEFYKNLDVQDEKLYSIFEGENYGQYDLEIRIPESGFKAFTFTFG